MNKADKTPAVLTIAGSDSGGGAGIQTDLRTFNAFRVYGCSAITAVTAQNPDEVRRVDVLEAAAVRAQIETVLDSIPVRFAKTGMLANREIIECVVNTARERKLELVVDPVMVSTSGSRLLQESAISAIKEQLLPLAQWLTPNIPEAEIICGRKITSSDDLASAALEIYEQYGCSVILKSGRLTNEDNAADMICRNGELFILSSPWLSVAGNTVQGAGCTLSAALTSNLALGFSWDRAVMNAKAFVYGALADKVFLSDTLSQMYPPEKSYFDQVVLTKC